LCIHLSFGPIFHEWEKHVTFVFLYLSSFIMIISSSIHLHNLHYYLHYITLFTT
jgi:hypothetical protein